MARDENPPFERGQTYFGIGGTTDATQGAQWVGREFVFEDKSPTSLTRRTNLPVRCRVIRNTSSVSIPPKRLIQFATAASAGVWGQVTDPTLPIARTDAVRCNPLDEYLPSAGLPANDLGYIVVRGPAMCLTSLTNMTAHVNKGDTVVCQTAATSGATNAITGAGRINSGDLTGATAALANQILNHFVAMSGISSGSTNTDMLVFVKG